jgi:hypothetical protein
MESATNLADEHSKGVYVAVSRGSNTRMKVTLDDVHHLRSRVAQGADSRF